MYEHTSNDTLATTENTAVTRIHVRNFGTNVKGKTPPSKKAFQATWSTWF